MKQLVALSCSALIAVIATGTAAQAMPLHAPAGLGSASAVLTEVGYICGPGYHLGPHGKYCWPNGHPPVPAGYGLPCPPGYHLGPKGRECWPNH